MQLKLSRYQLKIDSYILFIPHGNYKVKSYNYTEDKEKTTKKYH